jgi:hypothetical protein
VSRQRGRVGEGAEQDVGLTYVRFRDLDGAGERPAVGFDGQADLRLQVCYLRRTGGQRGSGGGLVGSSESLWWRITSQAASTGARGRSSTRQQPWRAAAVA